MDKFLLEENSKFSGCGCLTTMAYVIFSGTSLNYLLMLMTGKILPSLLAIVLGIFVGWATIPIAFVVWIINTFSY